MTAIVRRRPLFSLAFREPFRLLNDFETLATELWDSWPSTVFDTRLQPSLDMYEEKDHLVVKAELPGIDKEGLDITLEDGVLRIKGERKEEKEETREDSHYYALERHYGQYYRSVRLPLAVDDKKVSATFENGVLEIKLPKAEEAKVKRIDVKPALEAKAGKKSRKAKAKRTDAKT